MWAIKRKKPNSLCSSIEQCNLSMKRSLVHSVCFSFPSSPSVPKGMCFHIVCVARMLPQLVKLGKSARWSSHFLFTSAGKQATGKTTHSTYLHHSPASVSSLLLQASPHSHAFLCSVCSFPISLHAFPLLPLTSYLRLFLLIPFVFHSFMHKFPVHSPSSSCFFGLQ